MTTLTALPWCLPLIYLLSAIPAFLLKQDTAWRIAERAAAAALLIACVVPALAVLNRAAQALRVDHVGMIMALLIALLGWVIVRYSRRYLQGEPGQARYVAAIMATLASVATVAIADHLAVIAAAWAASSVGLHHLLTFYRSRRAAQIVAHKKFLVSRLADLCMVAALALFYLGAGTFSLHELASPAAAMTDLPVMLHAAMALVALAAIFKSAQLPFHGWLIQVMEAPTPVSALLHAGIVNLGGFVLIRLAAPLSAAPVAQALLVLTGSITAVLAGLVMMTRISVKVRLAWSTCAQMGFMLMECGLGLYDLAFLHLVAHSLYKAHAFLSAGETVLATRRAQMLPAAVHGPFPATLLLGRLAAVPLSVALVILSLWAWRQAVPALDLQPALVLILGLGLAPLLWREDGWTSGLLRGVASIGVLVQLYLAWHVAFGLLAPAPAAAAPMPMLVGAWIAACFLSLYVTQTWLITFPDGRFSRTLYPWAYYGFYLDERFTRLTFRIWPVRMQASPDPFPRPLPPLLPLPSSGDQA